MFSLPAFAENRIAVLDFELHDLTLLPRAPEELKRTAAVAPLLREALENKDTYESVIIDPDTQAKANVAFGYLFDRPELAAELGERYTADWVAIGRVHKPSYLFAYLKVRLVNVRERRLVGDFAVEVKGYLKRLTERGVARLAEEIVRAINAAMSDRAAGSELKLPAIFSKPGAGLAWRHVARWGP